MAKHLVKTTSKDLDILLLDIFVANRKEGNEIVWDNEEQKIARGVTKVDVIVMYSSEQHDYGHPTIHKVWINASDIKAIYEAMQQVETITTGKEEDDLPF